jgi:hypothetical protein
MTTPYLWPTCDRASVRPNAQVERRAASDVSEQEVAYRRVRSNAVLGRGW